MSKHNPSDLVFTGVGMITAHGCGIDANVQALDTAPKRTKVEEYYVRDFNPAPHLSDRKVVKVVSARDVLGLVAFENCVKSAAIQKDNIDPERTGLYIGAPPSACTDNLNYAEGVEATRNSYGELQEAVFGNTYRSASPTTLLTGLPNNVLCYGSKTLDARGPNSNYTCLETSGHLSIIGAARAMRLGRLDCAIAGGYSAHSDPVFIASARRHGLLKAETETPHITPYTANAQLHGTVIAEGAAFVAMERRETAEKRGAVAFATLLASGMSSDAKGPYAMDEKHSTLTALIQRTIKQSGLTPSDLEVVMVTGSGIPKVDQVEIAALEAVYPDHKTRPVFATTSTVWGNLMEAGGVGELGLLRHAYTTGTFSQATINAANTSQREFDTTRTHAMILRASLWGEYTCLIVRMEGAQP